MRKLLTTGLLAMTLLASTGCYSVGLVTRSVAPGETHHKWMHGFIYGLVGSEVDTESMCGTRGVARVDTYMSLGNMVLAALTWGLYSPMSLDVTCAAGAPAAAPGGAPSVQINVNN